MTGGYARAGRVSLVFRARAGSGGHGGHTRPGAAIGGTAAALLVEPGGALGRAGTAGIAPRHRICHPRQVSRWRRFPNPVRQAWPAAEPALSAPTPATARPIGSNAAAGTRRTPGIRDRDDRRARLGAGRSPERAPNGREQADRGHARHRAARACHHDLRRERPAAARRASSAQRGDHGAGPIPAGTRTAPADGGHPGR
jgi:hypothetical protein|nr:MAG: hypothetical protein DIU60_02950 [Actinomycetota bacterium]